LVGMSTAFEVIAARHLGIKVLAIARCSHASKTTPISQSSHRRDVACYVFPRSRNSRSIIPVTSSRSPALSPAGRGISHQSTLSRQNV
jgi:hypothetical protein